MGSMIAPEKKKKKAQRFPKTDTGSFCFCTCYSTPPTTCFLQSLHQINYNSFFKIQPQ